MDSVLALNPAALGSILAIPEDLLLTEIYFLYVAEINRQLDCLILSGPCRSLIMLIGPI